MEDDWDLHAVVRSCSSTTDAAASTTVDSCSYNKKFGNLEQDCSFYATLFHNLFEPRRESFVEELHDLLKPFLPKTQQPSQSELFSPQNLSISPLSVLGGLQDLSSEQQQQQQQQVVNQFPPRKQQLFSIVHGSKPSRRSINRKDHLKRVCHVPAENLSSNMWSWRKYGQKPIKGSPYPRGYYRCSTSKGCMARKQVERNKSDPGMFVVTYTGEHNHPMPTHRNSLAGSTRQKSADTPTSDYSKKPEISPGASLSPAPEKFESSQEDLDAVEDDDNDDDFGVSKMALDNNFFAGLEDFTGECLSNNIPTDLQLPWLANNAKTTT